MTIATLEIKIGMNNDHAYSDTRLNDYAAFIIVKDEDGLIKNAHKTDAMKKASFVKIVKSVAAEFDFEVNVNELYADAVSKVKQRIAEAQA